MIMKSNNKKFQITPTLDPSKFTVCDNDKQTPRFTGTIIECEAFIRLAESNNMATPNGPIQLND